MRAVMIAALAFAMAAPACAQSPSYPTRNVSIVIPYPVGGSADGMAMGG